MSIKSFVSNISASFQALHQDMSIGVAEVSAYSSYMNIDGNEIEGCWYFNRLFVRNKFRGLGVATELMKKLINFIEEKKILLVCDVNPYGDLTKEQLISFYKKFGFQECISSFHDIQYKTLILDKRVLPCIT